MEAQLRVAIVGYGLSGAVFHAPLVAATSGMRVATVVSASPERAGRARQDIPGVEVLPTVDDLWRRASDHELVVIASPTGTHLAVGLAALEAGLPLVVDKPLAAQGADARRLAAAAASRGLLLTVFHNRRWDGDTLTLQRLLREGATGEAVRFESRFERFRAEVRDDAWREQVPAAGGGGVLLDLGSHVIDQALHLFGPARRLYGEVRAVRPGATVDDDAFIALEHTSGVVSHLWASSVAAVHGARVRLLGVAGGYEKHGLDIQEDALRAGMRPGDPAWGVDPPELWGRLVTTNGEQRVETERGDWPRFYQLTAEALRGGGPPPVDPQSAVAVVEAIDAARDSARDGRLVELG
ncbi:MAG TPA: Gfo/Idh/MocA family oxidoreductase [Candidatus Dormibacteraeota bacterium]|nr:Gfo/Idh/MocA family oxidoreductase [Candidatus Dormibacteraeota bacterium]